ncbi:gamma-glutamyl-gamma-aminobutyrate hydrolase family protein [Spelaeicoccus albus]|uniref:Putative glutamine amidotransferase n=1 Tax=Spelaeicoccus albus TaxID=1280376 RepID=A0A7Z0A9T9_9MICO|nr:gamma-glutamyl-gamma-aminobutyrate hydrolase family protein [Spelaeicoccus albus]NYI66992.1 putative glutamine amidotransferase [Spelaeicoccus albus]
MDSKGSDLSQDPGLSHGCRRPLIGLPTYYGRSQHGVWDVKAAFLHATYIDAVSRAGGRVALLPPQQAWTVSETAELDGLILTGGEDIDPARYGEGRGPSTGWTNTERDDFESDLYRSARAAGVPLLGICRGAQVINAVHGGTLYQHLPDVQGLDKHEGTRRDEFQHVEVATIPGTTASGVLGGGVQVRCHHHQGIDRLGSDLRVSARATDGGIEAIETTAPTGPMLLAVQWHPEESLDDLRLFQALVDAAAHRQQRSTHEPTNIKERA